MDEKLMVMEQERLSREKKRKENRKKFGVVGAVCLIAVIGGGWYLGWGRYLGEKEESTLQITASAGQEIIYAGLTSVKGNEITYVVAQEAQATDGGTSKSWEGERSEMGEERSYMGGKSEKPDVSDMPDMPDMSAMPDAEKKEEGMSGFMGKRGNQKGMADASTDSFTYNNVTYELVGETVTTLIPVGTDVTTKLGTVTTFSRLAAGDKVALVVEKKDGEQVIAAVYIID